jgi:hypothetical protein
MKKVKSEKKARAIIAETKATGVLASIARLMGRLVGNVARIAGAEDNLTATIEKAKAALAVQLEAAKDDWRAIRSEVKDKAERKALAQSIYNALQAAPHNLKPQRASDVLKKIGIQIREKSPTEATNVADENIEQLFQLADRLEQQDPRRVCALLSRAYGRGRKVYPSKKADA